MSAGDRVASADASLVLTLLDEAGSLPQLLASVERQTCLPAELVFVDGGSTDGTVSILERWAPPIGTTVRILSIPGANISAGRNAAIAAANHDLVAVTDAGTRLDPHWLERLVAALADDSGVDVASGFFRPAGSRLLERAIAFTVTPQLYEIAAETFLPSSRSVAFRKSIWARVGGYPEWLDVCEDLVFDLALRDAGARFAFVPDAQVTWSARPSLRAFARQYYRYARGDGKAGLWPRRHTARYGAYGAGTIVLSVTRAARPAVVALSLGFGIYEWKFLRRILSSRHELGLATVPALLLVPAITLVGDAAKMAGYPAGLAWRTRAGIARRSSSARHGGG